MSRKIVAGNWKMNKTWPEALQLLGELNEASEEKFKDDAKVIIAPPAPFLQGIVDSSVEKVFIAAQNCHTETDGAFTGEWSAEMLKSIGVSHCIVGHSERRKYFGETDVDVAVKIKRCLSNDIVPIYCCGEELNIRESGAHVSFVRSQLETSLMELSAEEISRIIIAYEPVWAIGTGKTATSEQAQEMHREIREMIRSQFGIIADLVPILYGGSCKPSNAAELFSQEDVDGGLIGGASLSASDFLEIIAANG